MRCGKQQGPVRTHSRGHSLPLPCGDEHSHTFPGHSKIKLTVLGKKDRRSLEVAAAVPWFLRKDRKLADSRPFCVCSNGRYVGKALCGAKSPVETRTTLTTVNQRQSERFYQTSAESLEVALTLSSFLRKKATRVILCFSVQND